MLITFEVIIVYVYVLQSSANSSTLALLGCLEADKGYCRIICEKQVKLLHKRKDT